MSRYDRGGRDYPRESRDHDVPSNSKRQPGFWIPTGQIHREVIQTEICFWLGNDARVKPATNGDTGQSGYLITAYRAPTEAMLEDLRKKSAMFGKEVSAKRKTGQASVRYEQSDTFRNEERLVQNNQEYAQYPKRAYEEYDTEQTRAPQYHEPPRQTLPGYPPNFIVAGQVEYGNQPRRDFPQGNPGMPYEPRQDVPYQPRTPQSMDDTPPISRAAPVSYVAHSAAQFSQPQAATRGPTQAYRDPATGRTVYVDAGYDSRYEAEPGRQIPSRRANEHHYPNMRQLH